MARPLDKIVNEKRLTRDPVVEAAIDVALGQDLDTLFRRAAFTDRTQPGYLPSECLVHLIRNSTRQSNGDATHNATANALLPFLLKRCEAVLKVKVVSAIATAEDLREEILAKFAMMFAEDLAPDGSYKLDFYEVRFNRSFRFFRIDAVRSELTRLNRIDDGDARRSEDCGSEGKSDITLSDSSAELAAPDIDATDAIFHVQMRPRLIAALNALPVNERTAFILHHHYDYKQESEDPTEVTVATLCRVSGRTIRTWLANAKAKLAALKEAT